MTIVLHTQTKNNNRYRNESCCMDEMLKIIVKSNNYNKTIPYYCTMKSKQLTFKGKKKDTNNPLTHQEVYTKAAEQKIELRVLIVLFKYCFHHSFCSHHSIYLFNETMIKI